jgi:hypothetical protein
MRYVFPGPAVGALTAVSTVVNASRTFSAAAKALGVLAAHRHQTVLGGCTCHRQQTARPPDAQLGGPPSANGSPP